MGFFSKWTQKNKEDQLKKATAAAGAALQDEKKATSAHAGKSATEHEHGAGDHEHAVSQTKPQVIVSAIGSGAVQYIVRPLITEKGTLSGSQNTYIFSVKVNANKRAIREAIEKMYGVNVEKVRTLRSDGKKIRFGRNQGQRSSTKKAYVTVVKGQSITVHKGV